VRICTKFGKEGRLPDVTNCDNFLAIGSGVSILWGVTFCLSYWLRLSPLIRFLLFFQVLLLVLRFWLKSQITLLQGVSIACYARIDEWMNADKTQLVWLGTRQQLNKLTTTDMSLSSTRVKLSSSVLVLGVYSVYIDSQLAMVDHVAAMPVMSRHLRQMRMIRSSLTLEAAKTLWCMHSSAADLITATVCCMESAIVCWQSCRLFRTQQRASLLEPGSSTTSFQFCVIFTGFL